MGNNVKLESKSHSKVLAAFSGKSTNGRQSCCKVQEGTGQMLMAAISSKTVFELLGEQHMWFAWYWPRVKLWGVAWLLLHVLFAGARRLKKKNTHTKPNQNKTQTKTSPCRMTLKAARVENWICKTELGHTSTFWDASLLAIRGHPL